MANDPAPEISPAEAGKEAAVTRTNCRTSAPDCAGRAPFGNFTYAVSCSIWWNNGAGGRKNFTLSAYEIHYEEVRHADTGACIGLEYGPPRDQPRFWIWVP